VTDRDACEIDAAYRYALAEAGCVPAQRNTSFDRERTMQPHEQRVLDEKRELDERLVKLVSFITSSPTFRSLDPEDQRLMREQRKAMLDYSDTLESRIARFTS